MMISQTVELNKPQSNSESKNFSDKTWNSLPTHFVSTKRKACSFDEERKRKIGASGDTRRGFSEASFDETEYYFDNNLRKVYPYYFTYTTFCKGRWVGKHLIDVFSDEFRAHSKEEYEKNINAGNVKINGKTINSDYIFKENDCVTNRTHRHETAVIAAPIKIICSNDDFVVVDKPPSIPVHPCGRYRHNCLLFILAKEHNLKDLFSVHRLDRLTSGVLVFTKSIKKSQEINEQIRERKVEKEYVCRVDGNFPDGILHCKEPIEVISPKMGICIVSKTGKECETQFEKLSYNGKSSIVSCKPLTGRMHQIRVHLQYLGHPIINDPIYNHPDAFGPLKGKLGNIGKSKEQLVDDLMKTHNLDKWLLEDCTLEQDTKVDSKVKDINDDLESRIALRALEYYIKAEGFEKLAQQYVKNEKKFNVDVACDLCKQKYMDPEPKDLILFLHALKYKGDGWEFKSELPVWAKSDWNEN